MKITIGEWKMRGGGKAIIGAINESSIEPAIGWRIMENGTLVSRSWQLSGSYYGDGEESEFDIIAPWTDPVPWDWSTTPPWINWIAMDKASGWFMYEIEPDQAGFAWVSNVASVHRIPVSHAPKWSGDWKLSKTMRPGYKEVK